MAEAVFEVRINIDPATVVKGGPGSGPHAGGGGNSSGKTVTGGAVREARDNYKAAAPKADSSGEKAIVQGHLNAAASWAKTGDAASRSGDSAKASEAYGNAKASLESARSAVSSSSSYHVDKVDSAVSSILGKSINEDVAACAVFKSIDESRVTVGLAYPADKPDVAIAADGHLDFAGKSAVEKACWAFTAKSRSIGLHHANGTEGHGEVVESGIHRGSDWIIKGDSGQDTIIKDGDWVMAVRWDEPTWSLIKERRLNGFSPQGRAKRGTPTPERLANLRSN